MEEARLADLQVRMLEEAGRLVAPGGRLVYVTCSVLADENEAMWPPRSPGLRFAKE